MERKNLTKNFDNFIDDAAKLIKEYLLACPEDALEIYCIEVPDNLMEMKKSEFLKFVLSIQNLVYDAVRRLNMETPLYHNVNQFLFASHKPITICAVFEHPSMNGV